jgi:hypothetical protein
MIITLVRREFLPSGVFGELWIDDKVFCYTGEHAYDLKPKVPDGEYTCKRGIHKLNDGVKFDTFQIMKVPGHWGILFHKGNWPQKDSDGCVLIGTAIGFTINGGKMLTASKTAFGKFMQRMEGLDEFQIIIKSI